MFSQNALRLVHGIASTSRQSGSGVTLFWLAAVAFVLFFVNFSDVSSRIQIAANLLVFFFVFAQMTSLRRLRAKIQAITQELSWARAERARLETRERPHKTMSGIPGVFNSTTPDGVEREEDGITVIIAVRNRECIRLRNVLRSLRAQSYPQEALHLVVVDYDSDSSYSEAYQRLCADFRADLLRVDYRAVWCKPEALNLGISVVKTRYTAIADVDIIYPSNYLAVAVAALDQDPSRIVHSTVLETGLDAISEETDVTRDFDKLRAHATPRASDDPRSTYIYGQGIICLRTHFIRVIGGFDEFYYGWGSEDDDLIKRLKIVGLYLHSIAREAEYLHHSHPKLIGLSSIEQERALENSAYRARTTSIQRNIGAPTPQLTEVVSSDHSRVFTLQQERRSISVIVPVFDHVDLLRTCLRALDSQTFPRDRLEVIVVDNGSTKDVKSVVGEFPRCIYVRESRVGSYAARNAGLAHARGEIVAFTDADCVPARDWLEKGHRYFFGPQRVSYLVGRIALNAARVGAESATERYEMLFSFNQARLLEHQGFGATANLFVRRNVFEEVGGFNPELFSAGDKELGQRITALGFRALYAEDTVVGHPTTNGLRELVKRHVRYMGGEFDLALLSGGKRARTAIYLVLREIYIVSFLPWHVLRKSGRRSLSKVPGIVTVGVAIRLARCKEALRLWLGGTSRRA